MELQARRHRLTAYNQLAEHLGSIVDALTWYRGGTGPFASVNFDRNHAHTILACAPGEHPEINTVFGLSIMAPYTRFPDQQQRHPRVMFPLSSGEFKSLSGEWMPATIGSAIVCVAGRDFAMRCTSTPFLTLWCQKTASIDLDGYARATAAEGIRRRRARTLSPSASVS
ncbi:dimethylsulfonioproprionate lyase family protein [Shinella sp. DD12]|uniref:dimethylsulfonioproprionate lyase family protein n=1 Tax=Shinella sp. DD12 TaxID=1410620 RepID=UPI001FD9BCA9|nr:dimethylsulfonioproprionate lyase family protein [Shinella sp. DD12]